MGWEGDRWRVSVTLDAHAGEKERQHDALWRELQARLAAVCAEERYAELMPNYDEPEHCLHQSSMLTYCTLPPGHDGEHVYRDSSGEYTEHEEVQCSCLDCQMWWGCPPGEVRQRRALNPMPCVDCGRPTAGDLERHRRCKSQ